MSSGKCERCGTEDAYYIISMPPGYLICRACLNEWYDNGYYNIWHTLYHHSRELADKLVLDYLGKLG